MAAMVKDRSNLLTSTLQFLITLISGLICYGYFFNRGLNLSNIANSLSPAERVLNGEVPYRDFLYDHAPGVLWVNALLMKLFGVTIMAARFGLLGFKLATLVMLVLVGRQMALGWAAMIPAALTLAWFGYGEVLAVQPDQYFILFALMGLSFMLRYVRGGGNKWLVMYGVSASLVCLFEYTEGLLLIAIGLPVIVATSASTEEAGATAARPTVNFAKDVIAYLVGFGIVGGSVAAYLTYRNAFGVAADHFIHYVGTYQSPVELRSPSEVLPFAVFLVPALAIGFLILIAAGRAFAFYAIGTMLVGSAMIIDSTRGKVFNCAVITVVTYFPWFLFAAALACATWQLLSNAGFADYWRNHGSLTVVGLFAFAVFLDLLSRTDFYHLVRLLPLVFVLLCAWLVKLLPVLKRRLRMPSRLNALLVVSAPIIFLFVAGEKNCWEPGFDSQSGYRLNKELTIERGRGIQVHESQSNLVEGLVSLIQSNSSPEDPIFSFAERGGAFYFLAARNNPTRLLWWAGASEAERQTVMSLVADKRTRLIVIQDTPANSEIKNALAANYHRLGAQSDLAIFARNE